MMKSATIVLVTRKKITITRCNSRIAIIIDIGGKSWIYNYKRNMDYL